MTQEDDIPQIDIDLDRLLWALCRGLYALNSGEELEPRERLFLKVCERRLADRLGEP